MPRLSTLQIGAESFQTRGGGLNRYFSDLLTNLPVAGADCRALLVDDNSSCDSKTRVYASPKDSILRRMWAERKALQSECATHHFDVIATHFAPYALPAISFRSEAMPLVVHFHGPWSLESKFENGSRLAVAAKHQVEHWVYRRVDRCITLSNAFAEMLSKTYDIDRARIDVVPGGIDWQRFNVTESRAECRARLGWPQDRPIVLCVRRLVRRMGLENLLLAACEMRRKNPDVLFLIGGTGMLRPELEAQITRQHLEKNVRLLGFIPDTDLPLAYRAADVSIVPSLALEGFGLIAAESLAAGTPAVVARIGGLPEVVEGLPYSLTLADNSAATIAERLYEILKQDTAAWQDTCREFARRYDWNLVAPQILNAYRRAISGAR